MGKIKGEIYKSKAIEDDSGVDLVLPVEILAVVRAVTGRGNIRRYVKRKMKRDSAT